MDAAAASLRIAAMWGKLARSFERSAHELAKSESSLDRVKAIDFGRAAEACYWQATGDEDCVAIKDVS